MTCSDTAWHECWSAFDRRAKQGEVVISRRVAEEVFDCAGRVPRELVIKSGRHQVRLRRQAFFEFLNRHGRECR